MGDDAEREAVVERLRVATAEGRLTFGELTERTEAAYTALPVASWSPHRRPARGAQLPGGPDAADLLGGPRVGRRGHG
jgi:hypothetical protein